MPAGNTLRRRIVWPLLPPHALPAETPEAVASLDREAAVAERAGLSGAQGYDPATLLRDVMPKSWLEAHPEHQTEPS
jgi:hypothetical protein